jgi:hypothetical protein
MVVRRKWDPAAWNGIPGPYLLIPPSGLRGSRAKSFWNLEGLIPPD